MQVQLDALEKAALTESSGFERAKADELAKKGALLEQFKQKREAISQKYESACLEHREKVNGLRRELENVESSLQHGKLTEEEDARLLKLKTQRVSEVAELFVLKNLGYDQEIQTCRQRLTETRQQIQVETSQSAAAAEYLAIRTKLSLSALRLPNVDISLYRVVKSTGEIKNAFDITYQGRDYRCLSHSEKNLAGMEISDLMKRLTGRNYPIFVDNAESIERLPKPGGQGIVAVVRPNTPLRIQIVNDQAQKLPKAS